VTGPESPENSLVEIGGNDWISAGTLGITGLSVADITLNSLQKRYNTDRHGPPTLTIPPIVLSILKLRAPASLAQKRLGSEPSAWLSSLPALHRELVSLDGCLILHHDAVVTFCRVASLPFPSS
jgi:hypothetical protein